jgi:hypothetical protein
MVDEFVNIDELITSTKSYVLAARVTGAPVGPTVDGTGLVVH